MGQHSSRLGGLREALRANQEDLKEVELKGMQLSDKAIKKLCEALRRNKLVTPAHRNIILACSLAANFQSELNTSGLGTIYGTAP